MHCPNTGARQGFPHGLADLEASRGRRVNQAAHSEIGDATQLVSTLDRMIAQAAAMVGELQAAIAQAEALRDQLSGYPGQPATANEPARAASSSERAGSESPRRPTTPWTRRHRPTGTSTRTPLRSVPVQRRSSPVSRATPPEPPIPALEQVADERATPALLEHPPTPMENSAATAQHAPKPNAHPSVPVSDLEVLRIAEEISARHGIAVIGFDRMGVPEQAAREIAETIAQMSAKYPIPLRGIEIAELPAGVPAQLIREIGAEPERTGVRIAINGALLAQAGTKAGPAVELRSVIVREFGRALDVAGGFRARMSAQKDLLGGFLRIDSRPGTLTADALRLPGQLDPGQALAEAFAEVELSAGHASDHAKHLHRLLLSVVPREMKPRR
ncbi:hypothetical protein [Nocardia panacis]|uniref:hypothetical protein n=1 Tax=Nocardia panacis TaxID=2340916 RepID=UPI0011C39CFD|nr:hypothetical protein [Nocardia panacis]